MDSNKEIQGKRDPWRPPKYCEEMLEKAEFYLHNWEELGDVVPLRAGLCVHLGITRQTVWQWCQEEDRERFSYIVKEIDDMQEQVLIKKGLNKTHDSGVTRLMMARHGYAEKHLNEHTGADGKPMNIKWEVQPVKAIEPPKGDDDDSGHAQGADSEPKDQPA